MNVIRANKKLMGVLLGVALCFGSGTTWAADYSIKVAYENNPGEPIDKAVNEWAKIFAQKTGGKGELKLYPSSQLGSKKDVMEQMKLGSAIITIADGGFFADYVPDFGILMGPYLGNDYKDIFKLAKTPWFEEMNGKLAAKGFRILTSNWLYGTRHMVTKKPVKTPEDLKGLKIRVPNNRIQIDAMKTMGATPTPMPLGEVYPALTTGVIDGAENPIPVLYGGKMFEGAKFLLMTKHQVNLSSWIAGTKFIAKLPPEIVKMLKETGEEAGKFLDKENEAADKDALQKMQAAGVKVVEVDRAAFKVAMKDFPARFSKEFPPEIMNRLYAIIGHK